MKCLRNYVLVSAKKERAFDFKHKVVWRSPLLFLSTECQRVHAHLLDHCHQAVRAGRAEVLFQADLFNEVKIGIQYFLRGVVGQDADQQRDDPFDDYRIALPLNRILPST